MSRAKKKPLGKKNAAPRPNSYGVYFDESEKNGVYVFTAALIRESAKQSLERRLLSIREEITREVLRVAPHLAEHPKLANGKLLEIHAVDLYQSGGIFRRVKRVAPNFWHKQHEWLRQALEAAKNHGVIYIMMTQTAEALDELIHELGLPSDKVPNYRFKSVIDRFDSVFKNPYFVSLLVAMHRVNDFLREKDAFGKLYCHTYDDAHSYSVLRSYETVRTRGHFERLEPPVFRTCSEEQGIQCADAAGYVLLQGVTSQHWDTPLKPEFRRWGQRYIQPNLQADRPTPTEEGFDVLGLIMFEIFAANPGGPHTYQVGMRQLMADHLRQWAISEPPMGEFLQRALDLYDRTNKPPSEDGDLCGGTLPLTGNSEQPEDDP